MNISLTPMTKELARQFYKEFAVDPDLFADPKLYKPYVYVEKDADDRVDRYARLGRVYIAIMLDSNPIGETVLKHVDWDLRCCTMGISMIHDGYKNRGYGTQAEKLILRYAFQNMNMETVYADALLSNTRSRHVLEKVGFKKNAS